MNSLHQQDNAIPRASRAVRLEKQKGAVLIVSLVMLTILTIIALGTATDIGLQSSMARNSQISLRAFNVSLSELQSQSQASKNDEPITNATYLQMLANVYQTNNDYDLAVADFKMPSVDNPFTQTVTFSFVREGVCGGGNQIGKTGLIFELDSTSTLVNTGINSDQTFGMCYPNPNTN